VDRYLASLRASSPTYEDPYAYWGGTRPALQYGLPPEQPRPDTAGWPSATTDYGMGHTPAGMPPMGAPPPVVTGLGGPRPSTPTGTILPQSPFSLQSRYNAAADRARGYNGENGMGRAQRWLNDLYRMATPQEQQDPHFREWAERYAQGGVRWAETHEPGFGPTGFAHDAATPENTYNPGQALAAIRAGQDPAHVQADQRGLSVVPGQGGAADPAQRAADHITQALSGGTTGGATMADTGGGMSGTSPAYAPTAGTRGAMPYDQTAATPGPGALTSTTAGQMLSDPAALQAYIAALGGAPIGDQSFRAQYVRQSLVPMIQASIQTLTGLGGETSADQLGQNIQHYLSMLGGTGGFGQLRGEATKALQNPDLYGNLGLLTDQEAAQRLNQLVGLATAGTGDLYSEAMRQRGLNALSQRHVDQAFLPLGQEAPKYANYFQALPWVQALMGGR
jgi:hypothetical protein